MYNLLLADFFKRNPCNQLSLKKAEKWQPIFPQLIIHETLCGIGVIQT
tara:strand:+ start:376 stop:519 length:144 start_codon:yes stop_codon:yes gene_type:complete